MGESTIEIEIHIQIQFVVSSSRAAVQGVIESHVVRGIVDAERGRVTAWVGIIYNALSITTGVPWRVVVVVVMCGIGSSSGGGEW